MKRCVAAWLAAPYPAIEVPVELCGIYRHPVRKERFVRSPSARDVRASAVQAQRARENQERAAAQAREAKAKEQKETRKYWAAIESRPLGPPTSDLSGSGRSYVENRWNNATSCRDYILRAVARAANAAPGVGRTTVFVEDNKFGAIGNADGANLAADELSKKGYDVKAQRIKREHTVEHQADGQQWCIETEQGVEVRVKW